MSLAKYWRETLPMRRVVYGNPETYERVASEFSEDELYLAFTGSCRDDPHNCIRCRLRDFLNGLGAAVAAILLALWPSLALAQSGAPSTCGPVSVGTGAVAMTFPASGATGPSAPTQYLTIVNPHASATCWVNPRRGGTAAANAAGSIPLNPLGGSISWSVGAGFPPPSAASIICSGAATPVTCNYR